MHELDLHNHTCEAFRRFVDVCKEPGVPSCILRASPMNHQSATTRESQTRPSRLYLPKLESPPATIFEHLLARFPQVQPLVWRARVSRGLVTLSDGSTLREDSPYRHGIFVFYRKEAPTQGSYGVHWVPNCRRSLLPGHQGKTE